MQLLRHQELEEPGALISLHSSAAKIPSGHEGIFFILPHPSVHTNQWIKIPAVLDVDLGLNAFLQWSSSNCRSVNKPSNFSHVTPLQTKWNYTTHLTIHKRSLKLQRKPCVKEQNLLETCRWEIREEINETLMLYATKFVPNMQHQGTRHLQTWCRTSAPSPESSSPLQMTVQT